MTAKYQIDADIYSELAEQAHRRTEIIAERHGGCVWHWSDAPITTEGPVSLRVSAVLAVLRFEGVSPSDELYEALYLDLHDVFRLALRMNPLSPTESATASSA